MAVSPRLLYPSKRPFSPLPSPPPQTNLLLTHATICAQKQKNASKTKQKQTIQIVYENLQSFGAHVACSHDTFFANPHPKTNDSFFFTANKFQTQISPHPRRLPPPPCCCTVASLLFSPLPFPSLTPLHLASSSSHRRHSRSRHSQKKKCQREKEDARRSRMGGTKKKEKAKEKNPAQERRFFFLQGRLFPLKGRLNIYSHHQMPGCLDASIIQEYSPRAARQHAQQGVQCFVGFRTNAAHQIKKKTIKKYNTQ